MKYCIECNTELTDQSKYCNECGKNQSTDEYYNEDGYEEQDLKNDNYTREPVYKSKVQYRENSDYEEANSFHKKRKRSPIFIICLTVIVVAVAAFFALGLVSNNKNKSNATKVSPPTVAKSEPGEANIQAKLHQKVTVKDTVNGTYEVTINSISKTAERNKIQTTVPVEVYKINYTYKLISKGTSTRGFYLSGFDSFDSTGEAGDIYLNRQDSYPKMLTIIGSKCSADISIAVKNKSTFLNLVLDYYINNESRYVTFNIPTK